MAIGDIRSLNPDWLLRSFVASRERARRGIDAAPQVPEFLLSGSLEPFRTVAAEVVPERLVRGVFTATPVQFSVEVDRDTPVVAIARHESGALTFHLPAVRRIDTTRSIRRGQRSETAVFTIETSAEVRGQEFTSRRGLVGRVVRVVIMRVTKRLINPIADHTIAKLAQLWESRAWRGRPTGWKQVEVAGMVSGDLKSTTPKVPRGSRALVLIHGTFSHTATAFRDLVGSGALAEFLRAYDGRVYGFDHFSVSATPDENAADFLKGIDRQGTLDVVTHSRGGLVLRTILTAENASRKFKIGRVVLAAAPNQGTPLATPGQWERSLAWITNLLEIFPDNTFTTAGELVTECLSWLAQHVTGSLPGIAAMDRGSKWLKMLQLSSMPAGDWYALATNYEPRPSLVSRLVDMGIDSFFGAPNDLVVPTEGAWQLGQDTAASIHPDHIGCFGPGGNLTAAGVPIHHTNIFSDPRSQEFLANALAGESTGLGPLTFPSGQPHRRLADVELETAATVRASSADEARKTPVRAGDGIYQGDESSPEISSQPFGASVCATRVAAEGWDEKEPLHLIVLPPDRGNKNRLEAQLLAIYGSARVLSPFRLGGETDAAGGRWNKIISFHKDVNHYADGLLDNLDLNRLRDGGVEMFNVLFQGDVRRLYDQARYRHPHRKLNVVFTSLVPWVADLPWEFAFDPSCEAFLSTSDVRFVRNVLTPVPADNIPSSATTLKILVVAAAPTGVVALSEDEEITLMKRKFQMLIESGAVTVDVIPRATPGKLHERVMVESYDVIHFIGHGTFDRNEDTGYLVFEDDDKQALRVSTSTLKDILRGRGIRLMFLNACESAEGGRADYNQGVAPGLVGDGIPAVLANQYSVLDRSATLFSQFFYGCLTQGLSLGDAMRESRIALKYATGGDPIGWAVPVLFARNPDATLCRRSSIVRLSTLPELMAGPRIAARSMSRQRRDETIESTAEPYHVAVWDVTDSFTELDETIETLNAVQGDYEFFQLNMSVPYGTWRMEKARFNGVAYLSAERVAKRLRPMLTTVNADYMFCVTDRPLASEDDYNLYAWSDDKSDYRINIFSTWGFSPPLRGERFSKALTNVLAGILVAVQSGAEVDETIPGSLFFYNAGRDDKYVTGRLSIPPGDLTKILKTMNREQITAVEAMLAAYHGDEPPLPIVVPKRAVRRTANTRASGKKVMRKRSQGRRNSSR